MKMTNTKGIFTNCQNSNNNIDAESNNGNDNNIKREVRTMEKEIVSEAEEASHVGGVAPGDRTSFSLEVETVGRVHRSSPTVVFFCFFNTAKTKKHPAAQQRRSSHPLPPQHNLN